MRTLSFLLCLTFAACATAPPYPVGAPAAGYGDAGGDTSLAADSASGQDTTSSQDAAPGQDAPGATSPLVAKGCIDGQYQEAVPANTASLAELKASYDQADAQGFLDAVLALRSPVGRHVLQVGIKAKLGGNPKNCFDTFLSAQQRKSAGGVLGMASTLVHECGHFADLAAGGFANSTYIINQTTQFSCAGASHGGNNQSFARSLLLGDAYAPLRPPCGGKFGQDCDHYADIYLNGDANDATFQGGDQGYSSVLEETVQYVNSLATDYALEDQIQSGGKISARDGILTFLWYLQRYLRLARLEHPKVYAYIAGNDCWRKATLTTWGRAWLYLEATKGHAKLSLAGDKLYELATAPELLSEIQRLREAAGCQ